MNRYEIANYIMTMYNLPDFDINNLEGTLFAFAGDDYFHPTKRIQFPLIVLGLFGKGTGAIVLEVQDSLNETFALRLSGPVFPENIFIQNVLTEYAMAPELFYVGRTRAPGVFFTIMENITDSLEHIITNEDFSINKTYIALKCLLDKKYLLNLIHGDMHLGNIVVLKDGYTLGFIDFEWSFFIEKSEFTFLNFLDFIPLLGSLKNSIGKIGFSSRAKNYFEHTFTIKIDWDKFRVPQTGAGGFEYNGLFSYLKNYRDKNALGQIAAKIPIEFPTFSIPKIVD